MEEASTFCEEAKSKSDNFFQYFGKSLKQDDYSVKGWEGVVGFSGFS